MSEGWLLVVIHPQTGTICDSWRHLPDSWPEEGFLGPDLFGRVEAALWPVPNIRGARLVDCRCGKTGVQPLTWEDAARYIPGSRLEDGKLVVESNPLVKYPDGSGGDEESEVIRSINDAFAHLKMVEDAYRRHFPEGRLGPPREDESG